MSCSVCDKRATVVCPNCHQTRFCGLECYQKVESTHQDSCFALERSLVLDKKNIMLQHALRTNLFSAYQSLSNRIKVFATRFDIGRYYVFKGIVAMIIFDPVQGDMKEEMTDSDKELWRTIYKDIHTGGELIASESTGRMHDPLIWSFIPQPLHREVDVEWDGIGDWKA